MTRNPDWTQEYQPAERTKLIRAATSLLGSELCMDLHLPEDADQALPELIVSMREKLVTAMVKRVRFYPTQEPAWQQKLRTAGVENQPWHLRAGWSSGNPHMLAVLQRNRTATTDPLAEPNELLVTTNGRTIETRKWKKFLTEDLNLTADEIKRLIPAMNGAHLLDASSPVQISRPQGVTFDHDELEIPEDAHADLQGDFALSAKAEAAARQILIGRWQELQRTRQA